MRILCGFFLLLSTVMWSQQSSSTVVIDQKIEDIIAVKKALNQTQFETQYYAIQLYYGNYTAAQRIATAFKEAYPSWEAKVDFDSPNYKVRVGRFKELSIAQQNLEVIRKEYPAAFLLEPNNL